MHAEFGNGLRRRSRMTREDELWLRAVRWLEFLAGQRFSSGVIGPAIPFTRFDPPQDIRRAPDRPAASLVVSVVRHVELPVRRECETKWITKSPGDPLQPASVWPHPQN